MKESLKYQYPEQILIEFYTEMEDNWLDIFCSVVFINNAKRLLEYALSLGYKGLNLLLQNYDSVSRQFMNRHWYEDNIEDMDMSISALKGYRKAA